MTRNAAITVILLAAFLVPIAAEGRTVTVAVVQDGRSAESEIVNAINGELKRLLEGRTRVVFKTSPLFDAQWTEGQYRRVIQNALQDPGVDVLLGVGALVTQAAAEPGFSLSKPFVSVTALNGQVPRMPYRKNRSTKKNLSFVLMPVTLEEELKAFRDLIDCASVHVALDALAADDLKALEPTLEQFSGELGMQIELLPVTSDITETLSRLPLDVEGVFLVRMPRIRTPEREAFIEGLNGRKIPTFSELGPRDVERGVLGTLTPELDKQRVRRVAVNLYHIIKGDGMANLPVFLKAEPQLLINARTAVAIGYDPNYQARMYARFLHPDAFLAGEQPLDLRKVLEMAAQGNTSLMVSGAQVEISRRDRQVSLSPLLPQVEASVAYNYTYLDSSTQLVPDDTGAAGVSLRQVIFDDEKISSYREAGRTYNAARYRNETDLYDVFAEAARTYLLFVQARILYQVEQSNLELLQGNLEIARMRFEAGISGRDEIYRWEAQVLRQRAIMLDRDAEVQARRIALNQILGIDQETTWRPEEIELDPEKFSLLGERMALMFQSPKTLTRFGEASIRLALENAPEIKYLDQTIQAQDIRVGQRKRSFFLPKFNAGVSYYNNFYQSPALPDLGENEVLAEVVASLPLFEGTRRIFDLKREESVRDELDYRMALALELVEKQTRQALKKMNGSFPGIKLNREAADSARANLEIVREKYAQGTVNITDLLDAQNTSYTTEQDAVAALYAFLLDLVDYQRAISFFENDKTPEQLEQCASRIREFMGVPE